MSWVATAEAAGFRNMYASHGSSMSHDYKDALTKSILFFEGERSGKLPPNQRMRWRGDSALKDGATRQLDLTRGCYAARDDVKFGFHMAFTTTMLSEFGGYTGDDLQHVKDAIRWATGFLLKTTSQPGVMAFMTTMLSWSVVEFGGYRGHDFQHAKDVIHWAKATSQPGLQVADPKLDHNCWERLKEMDPSCDVYKIDTQHVGSDVAAETAAALVAASIVFQQLDSFYSQLLLQTSMRVFDFADKYSDSLHSEVCPFYCSYSGYHDELLWGATWFRRATGNAPYLNYIQSNGQTLGAEDNVDIFSWDEKHAGSRVLLAQKGDSGPNCRGNAIDPWCSPQPPS